MAELLQNRVLKKCTWLGQRVRRLMRYTQAEKLEIIRLMETSDLPAKQTLAELGVPRSTFYPWYERYRVAGPDGLITHPAAGTTAVLEPDPGGGARACRRARLGTS